MLEFDRRVRSLQPLALLTDVDQPERPFGARTDAGVVVGELLMQHVPELASGELEIVAIARSVGQLSKVAVRQRLRVQPGTARPVLLVLGRAGEHIRPVRDALGQERVDIVQWHAEPLRYIADALGLTYLPSAVLYPVRRRADVLARSTFQPRAARVPATCCWPQR